MKLSFAGFEPEKKTHCSDATGWDMSLSSTSFWTTYELRLSRADGQRHYRSFLVSGFFQLSWLVCAGSELYESVLFGLVDMAVTSPLRSALPSARPTLAPPTAGGLPWSLARHTRSAAAQVLSEPPATD